MPFTGDSSDDSSDGEGDHTHNLMNHSGTRATNSSSENTGKSTYLKNYNFIYIAYSECKQFI